MSIEDAIYREVIYPWYDDQLDQQAGPDEDTLRAAFLAGDHGRVMDPTVRHCLAVIAAAFLILLIVWAVTA